MIYVLPCAGYENGTKLDLPKCFIPFKCDRLYRDNSILDSYLPLDVLFNVQ